MSRKRVAILVVRKTELAREIYHAFSARKYVMPLPSVSISRTFIVDAPPAVVLLFSPKSLFSPGSMATAGKSGVLGSTSSLNSSSTVNLITRSSRRLQKIRAYEWPTLEKYQ